MQLNDYVCFIKFYFDTPIVHVCVYESVVVFCQEFKSICMIVSVCLFVCLFAKWIEAKRSGIMKNDLKSVL